MPPDRLTWHGPEAFLELTDGAAPLEDGLRPDDAEIVFSVPPEMVCGGQRYYAHGDNRGSVAKVTDDLDVLLAFYDYPAEHWIHLRTTNPVESPFAAVRLRT